MPNVGDSEEERIARGCLTGLAFATVFWIVAAIIWWLLHR
jgi:hypothetical protein